ncbi:MAG TPA: helicase-related protein [Candidatus Xenobia bacterium]|jgi:superfamily II DNA or RNA helicase
MFSLRRHQAETRTLAANANLYTLIANVCPGGGKSLLPVLAAAATGLSVCWVVPRKSLQVQAEEVFVDPHFRQALGHTMSIRASGNEDDMPRGTRGYVTTYQAIAERPDLHLRELARRPYLLVLDEFHHLVVDCPWSTPVREMERAAHKLLLMSGTLETGNGRKIEFLTYRADGAIDLSLMRATAMVQYTRSEALRGGDIKDISMELVDCEARWSLGSDEMVVESFEGIRLKDARHALFTALQTEFAQQLLTLCVEDWRKRRALDPTATLMVVAPDIPKSKEYKKLLTGMGVTSAVATSDESVAAQRAIKAFKAGKYEALVTVAMAYEGLDVPSITHLACLTRIRSKPWIEQMLARAARINRHAPEATRHLPARVFAPKDHMLARVWHRIQDEYPVAVGVRQWLDEEEEELLAAGRQNGGGGGLGIQPLSSGAVGYHELLASIQNDVPVQVETPSEKERRLRESINAQAKRYAMTKGLPYQEVFGKIVRQFGKRLPDMRGRELEAVESWCRRSFA